MQMGSADKIGIREERLRGVWWVVSGPAPISFFLTSEEWDAARKKAWDWLDAQPKPPAAPKPEKTMKQQGDPDFKAFLDLGAKALSAWLAEQKPKVNSSVK